MMSYPYADVFSQIEERLIKLGTEGRHRFTRDEVVNRLNVYKHLGAHPLDDNGYFRTLVDVVFYSGFKANTVTRMLPAIYNYLSDYRAVAGYTDDDVARIMADPKVVRNDRKIKACINSARAIREIAARHGSMEIYVQSFNATDSFENLFLLKESLESKFDYLGRVTVYHFMMNIALPVLKPDRVICRIFKRHGLIECEDHLWSAVSHGRKFAEATGHPMRYIDIVLVAYGQSASEELGVDLGLCLQKPSCGTCPVRQHCRYEGKSPSASPVYSHS